MTASANITVIYSDTAPKHAF